MDLTKFVNKDGKVLQNLLDLLPVPIFYKDRDGSYLGCNQLFEKTLNLSKKEIIGKKSLDLYTKELGIKHIKMDKELFLKGEIQVYDGILELRGGSQSVFRFYKSIFSNEFGKPIGFICAAICIEAEKSLEKLAMYDSLTGLFNRRIGLDLLNEKIKKCKDKNEFLSVVIMDIDYFKKINDTYGHISGDKILQKVSKILKDSLRLKDVVFRYGGEEFIYVLPYINEKKAFLISERIRKKILRISLVSDDEIEIKISASFGISVFPQNGVTEDELIKKADNAMYEVKKNGRNGTGIAV